MIIRALIVWSAPTEKGWWGISVSLASSHSDGYSLGSTLNALRLLSQISEGMSDLSLNGQILGNKSVCFVNSSCLDRADTKGGLLSSLFQFVNISSITPLVLFCNILCQGWQVWICAIWLTRSDCRIYSSYVNASIKHFMRNYSNNSYIYNYSLHCWGIIALQWENAMVHSVLDGQLFLRSVKMSLYIRLFDFKWYGYFENALFFPILWLRCLFQVWLCDIYTSMKSQQLFCLLSGYIKMENKPNYCHNCNHDFFFWLHIAQHACQSMTHMSESVPKISVMCTMVVMTHGSF